MKKSFAAFWRRNLALCNLGIASNLEYRFNFIVDAFVQPILTVGIEVLLWLAIFKTAESALIGGFSKESYLAYAVWAPFLGRITISWMYESMMVEEVASGSINTVLSRPLSFYEYYLSQMMGYKIVTSVFSLLVPIAASIFFKFPIFFDRLLPAMALVIYYLLLVHTLSFIISTLGFFLTRVRSFTLVKNLTLWLLSGELVPIDLMPVALQKFFLLLPFSSGVYIPLAYITGRADFDLLIQGFKNVTLALIIAGVFSHYFWRRGLHEYTGTGA